MHAVVKMSNTADATIVVAMGIDQNSQRMSIGNETIPEEGP